MDFRYPPEAEVFRAEFRGWLDANLPDELRLDRSGGSLEFTPSFDVDGALGRARQMTGRDDAAAHLEAQP